MLKPEVASGNCLTYVFLQRLRHGGKVVLVKSQYGWWCHAYWLSNDGKVFEFAPSKPHRQVKRLWHPLPPLMYSGAERMAPALPFKALSQIDVEVTQPLRRPAMRPADAVAMPVPSAAFTVTGTPALQAAA